MAQDSAGNVDLRTRPGAGANGAEQEAHPPEASEPVERAFPDPLPAAEPFRYSAAWRAGTMTRADELESLAGWIARDPEADIRRSPDKVVVFRRAIAAHLQAARHAAKASPWYRRRTGARLERAMSSLDAVEADLLQIGSPTFVLGQMPTVLNDVQRYLGPSDPRRLEIERMAKDLGIGDPSLTAVPQPDERTRNARRAQVDRERARIVSAARGASSAALREQTRVRSFRNVVVATGAGMAIVAVTLGVLGLRNPTALPMCFAPDEAGQITVVCPTQQSGPKPAVAPAGEPATDIDNTIIDTAQPGDIFLVELIGLTAAAVAAAGAIRGIRGSSEPYGVPIALAVLKLPTGAVTALLGLLLMRGQFVPGLSALDTSAQILAWAIVFGYAQQLFTRLVDQQAHTVLDGVRNRATAPPAGGAALPA